MLYTDNALANAWYQRGLTQKEPEAYFRMGVCKFEQQDISGAIADFTQGWTLFQDTSSLGMLALECMHMGDRVNGLRWYTIFEAVV